MTQTFYVTADHICPDYRFEDEAITVGEYLAEPGRTMFYATHHALGCGKDAATPDDAIRLLVADHGCTNIRIRNAVPVKVRHTRVPNNAKLRVIIDGVALQTTARLLRTGAQSTVIANAFFQFESEHATSGITGLLAAFYDTHLDRDVQIQLDLEMGTY